MHTYTRHGDDGHTTLLSGQRVWKDDPRVRVCGDVDELCSWLGVVAVDAPAERPELAVQVRQVQCELFAVGATAQLNGHLENHPQLRPVGARECSRIERWIDAIEADLPPLDGFVVPGGCRAAAVTHVARSVCRRIERDLVALARTADAEGATVLTDSVAYFNRLADFLFVLARFCNHVANIEEPMLGKTDDGRAR
jgi:cob(I)alamin adenosyltransferase